MEQLPTFLQQIRPVVVSAGKGLLWCIRITLKVLLGSIYLVRQALYGSLSYVITPTRVDNAFKAVGDGVALGADAFISQDPDLQSGQHSGPPLFRSQDPIRYDRFYGE